MTDQERSHVVDLLAAHDALIHWCETLTTAPCGSGRAEQLADVGDQDPGLLEARRGFMSQIAQLEILQSCPVRSISARSGAQWRPV